MTDNPAFYRLRHALAGRTDAPSCSTNELASAVRAQCADLSMGVPLMVVGHRLMWIEAEWGPDIKSGEPQIKGHSQTVLIVDGSVLNDLAPTKDRSADATDRIDTGRPGYAEGWFAAGVCQKYHDMLRDQRIDRDTLQAMAPRPFSVCDSATLWKVACALPEAISLWRAQHMVDLEAQATRIQALPAWLRGTTAA